MRYFFEISYKGTNYHGWQRQNNAISVQEVVENCLAKLVQEDVEITGSGRTDKGVHCSQQYFHCDIQSILPEGLIQKMNSFLPDAIAIRTIHKVESDNHARFDAISRRYKYIIQRRKNPFINDTAFLFSRSLETDLMNKAAELLLGDQDFQCFSKVKTDVHTFNCRIDKAIWTFENDQLIFDIVAYRFLRGMVRAIVGTLLEIGQGKRTLDDLKSLLKSGDRTKAGASVPARGLSLYEVKYPNNYFIKE